MSNPEILGFWFDRLWIIALGVWMLVKCRFFAEAGKNIHFMPKTFEGRIKFWRVAGIISICCGLIQIVLAPREVFYLR